MKNKIMNIALAVLVLILVLAVGIAVSMAGRIRKQETAQTAAESEAGPAESASEAKAAAESGVESEATADKSEVTVDAEATADKSEITVDAEATADESEITVDAEATADESKATADESEVVDAEATAGSEVDNSASAAVKTVHVEVDGRTVLECPLTGEAKYAIVDGTAVELDVDTTLEDMQGIADPANHDVNLIYIHDGKVACQESNCENQVCVHTGELTGSAFDLPIICLPHGLVVQVLE